MTTTTHPSAVERLAAALDIAMRRNLLVAQRSDAEHPSIADIVVEQGWSDAVRGMAESMLAERFGLDTADPTLAQDIEDGTELRLLREAAKKEPDETSVGVGQRWGDDGWTVSVARWGGPSTVMNGPTLAAAARACRDALEGAK